jgi:hypothetical protein
MKVWAAIGVIVVVAALLWFGFSMVPQTREIAQSLAAGGSEAANRAPKTMMAQGYGGAMKGKGIVFASGAPAPVGQMTLASLSASEADRYLIRNANLSVETSDATRALVGFVQSVWAALIWWGIWAAVWMPVLIIALVLHRKGRKARSLKETPPQVTS